ncbi:hypothetical protein F383_37989 [Gossypium arboreum]|uniref:Uncharacterized protein n=1 Tax=Gossypium arboreum TaxID=29729 RepID=A0A0B0MHF2_GOSAR|nr:hypothetical protein F383_37989 [Gossypium arboreum]
MGHPASFK